jgi:hypothetical protein
MLSPLSVDGAEMKRGVVRVLYHRRLSIAGSVAICEGGGRRRRVLQIQHDGQITRNLVKP